MADIVFNVPDQSLVMTIHSPQELLLVGFDEVDEEGIEGVEMTIGGGDALAITSPSQQVSAVVNQLTSSFVIGNITELLNALQQFQPMPGPAGEVVTLTLAELDALAAQGRLTAVIYKLSDTGSLAIARNSTTYDTYFGIHIGPTPPENTNLVWFNTSPLA